MSEHHTHPPVPLLVIGGGAMAQAILRGALDAGALDPGRIVVCDPDATKHDALRALGVRVEHATASAMDAAHPGAVMLLCVKPQMLATVAEEIGARRFDGLAVSILAGARSHRVREALGGTARVVRVMPNTPAQLRMGVSAVALGAGATPEDADLAASLFAAVGAVVRIDEGMMDAFTALAGSGPAYVFYLAGAMQRAALEMGFDATQGDEIVRATIEGAAALLARDRGVTADELRARVTSRKGTTQAATDAMDEAGVMDAIVRAVLAARDRGAALSEQV